ncbi:MAG: hypothetical protein DRG09_05765 [Epsilonproteobacteria bacterium]|nr:MAG: hypothetical protein DRG09_05765 [Campylobacterota bacterium]
MPFIQNKYDMILAMRTLTILTLFLFWSSSALAQTLLVGSQNEYNLLPHASLFHDSSQKMTLDEVQKESWTDISVEELAFPVSATAHWLKYDIENNSTTPKSYYLEYDISNIHFLDVYILQKGVVLQQYLTGSHRPLENRALIYHSYLFPLTLKAGERKEIYIRIKHLYSAISANMSLKEQTPFLLDDYAKNVWQGVFFGVMIVMFFYNLVLYLMTRYRPYLAYILYLGSFGTWISLHMGYGIYLFDFIPVGMYRYFEISIAIWFTVFIIWFITGVLDLKNIMPKSYKMFQAIALFFILSWANIIVFLFLDIDEYYVYPSLLFFINFLVMNICIVVISAMLTKKGNKTAFYILLAWMFFVSSMVILGLSLTNVIPPYTWIMPYMQVTMVIETVMLSLVLGDRYRQQEQLLRQQSRLASMGSMIENIAHQWRQPLSEINADLLALEMHIEDDDKENIKKRMQIIEEKTQMMSETIDDFQNFYMKDKSKETFDLEKLIQKSMHLLENRMVGYHIQCKIHTKETCTLYGVENEYLQVLLAILNNAIDALKKNDSEDRKLDIFLSKKEKDTVLEIKNNGKQIEAHDMMRIFEPYYTTKKSDYQNGIGLFMSKRIIEESFHGSLVIKNVSEGVNVMIKVAYV